jgi:hypothetical protein
MSRPVSLALSVALVAALLCVQPVSAALQGASTAGRFSESHAFVFHARSGHFYWEVGIQRKDRSGMEKDCLSAGIGQVGEGLGIQTICAPHGERPLVDGSSVGEGDGQGSVVGVVTSPRVKRLKVYIRGDRPRTVRVRLSSEGQAASAGLEPFGYAAVFFTGPGCFHRFVGFDASGRRVGSPGLGC